MPKAKIIEVTLENGTHHGWMAWCPGCDSPHVYDERWSFNGDHDAPTFKPSYLATGTYGENHEQRRCHTYLTDGKLQFLADCSHELAGTTVDLIEKFDVESEPMN